MQSGGEGPLLAPACAQYPGDMAPKSDTDLDSPATHTYGCHRIAVQPSVANYDDDADGVSGDNEDNDAGSCFSNEDCTGEDPDAGMQGGSVVGTIRLQGGQCDLELENVLPWI